MEKKDLTITLFFNKKADGWFTTKNLIYLILIAACVIIISLIVKGIINKLLTLY